MHANRDCDLPITVAYLHAVHAAALLLLLYVAVLDQLCEVVGDARRRRLSCRRHRVQTVHGRPACHWLTVAHRLTQTHPHAAGPLSLLSSAGHTVHARPACHWLTVAHRLTQTHPHAAGPLSLLSSAGDTVHARPACQWLELANSRSHSRLTPRTHKLSK